MTSEALRELADNLRARGAVLRWRSDSPEFRADACELYAEADEFDRVAHELETDSLGVRCPGCGVEITVRNAGGYRCYCETCVSVIPEG